MFAVFLAFLIAGVFSVKYQDSNVFCSSRDCSGMCSLDHRLPLVFSRIGSIMVQPAPTFDKCERVCNPCNANLCAHEKWVHDDEDPVCQEISMTRLHAIHLPHAVLTPSLSSSMRSTSLLAAVVVPSFATASSVASARLLRWPASASNLTASTRPWSARTRRSPLSAKSTSN